MCTCAPTCLGLSGEQSDINKKGHTSAAAPAGVKKRGMVLVLHCQISTAVA
jgi:hypothetical protein